MFMLHIQSSLSAAQTQGWNCAAFRSDPIRGKNPFRMIPRSSRSVQKSLRYQHIFSNIDHTKIHSYLTHFSTNLDDLGVILELILPRIKALLYAAQITLLFTLQIESLLSATFSKTEPMLNPELIRVLPPTINTNLLIKISVFHCQE